MGQYYKAYVKNAEERRFNPQNAVYMTVHGLDGASAPTCSWDSDDPTSYGSLYSGFKLMEHSWMGNDFVNGVLGELEDSPHVVAWVGDYACEESDFDGVYTEEVYRAVWGADGLDDGRFGKVPDIRRDGFLVNATKGAYVDLAEYVEVAAFTPNWDRSGGEWCIHPLPLLTAIGNGRGGGDYHGAHMSQVGSWAMDEIMYTRDGGKVDGLERIAASDIAFEEE